MPDVREIYSLFCDDITFCQERCDWTDCPRNSVNIRDKTVPHSFSVDTPEDCPKKQQPQPIDVDKVMNGLEICSHIGWCDGGANCPYWNESASGKEQFEICKGLQKDALTMLKARQGKWYKQLTKCPSAIGAGGSRTSRCSLCGGWGRKTFKFCPHCGAMMKDGAVDG